VQLLRPTDAGVLIAHGDHTGGSALRIHEGHLVHHYVHAGTHTALRSTVPVPVGRLLRLGVEVTRRGESGSATLVVDATRAGRGEIPQLARARTGYTGVDVGCDRGSTVGGYPAPARFTGHLRCIEIEAEDDQWLDDIAVLEIEGATG
jgi:arylsulfatase